MKIEELLDICIVALFRDQNLAQTLFLKGGSALRIFGDDDSRLSIDVDFSAANPIRDSDKFFRHVHVGLSAELKKHGFAVIDFKSERRPSKPRKGAPENWGGWCCSFKLVEQVRAGEALENQRRRALIPDGANSSVIRLDISEAEYCGSIRSKTVKGVRIQGYTRELLILEKIRAICQQHRGYKFALGKNRARDFFDIYRLSGEIDDKLVGECQLHLAKVFEAKKVPIELLGVFWDEEFIDDQRRGFKEVEETVRDHIVKFDICLEHIRYFVKLLAPEIHG